jgi:hypothetical protein
MSASLDLVLEIASLAQICQREAARFAASPPRTNRAPTVRGRSRAPWRHARLSRPLWTVTDPRCRWTHPCCKRDWSRYFKQLRRMPC